MNLLEKTLTEIREMSKDATDSSDVKLDISRVDILAESLQAGENPADHPFVTDPHLSPAEKTALVLLFGVVNYCYTDPETRVEYAFHIDGTEYARSTGFNQALLHSGLDWLDFDALSEISPDKWRAILQLDSSNHLYDAENRRVKFRTMAAYLKQIDVANFFETYNDTSKIFALLKETGLFEDPFYKRAQIVLSLLGRIDTLYGDKKLISSAPLTVMADYRLPQVLYNFGVLMLPEALEERLSRGDTFVKNEQYERQLRAWTIVLGEMLAQKLDITEEQVDARLWALSQDMIRDHRMNIPAMLVATDCY